MNKALEDKFLKLWPKYFPGADLPIMFVYTDDEQRTREYSTTPEHRCVIANLTKVRRGKPLRLDRDSVECSGGKRYLGFSQGLRPNFEYFLSYGIKGKLRGERYKKSPALVREMMKKGPMFRAPKKYIVFKRFDLLRKTENPDAVVFFAPPDVLAGLFTLACYDQAESGVITPFGAACGSIVLYPYLENKTKKPRCILGMFDPSARLYVPAPVLSFAVPQRRFLRMIRNMDESFLITSTWGKIRQRIGSAK